MRLPRSERTLRLLSRAALIQENLEDERMGHQEEGDAERRNEHGRSHVSGSLRHHSDCTVAERVDETDDIENPGHGDGPLELVWHQNCSDERECCRNEITEGCTGREAFR